MEIENLLPRYDFGSHYSRRIAADPDAVWRAYRELTTAEVPVTRLLLGVRALGRLRMDGPFREAFPLPVLLSAAARPEAPGPHEPGLKTPGPHEPGQAASAQDVAGASGCREEVRGAIAVFWRVRPRFAPCRDADVFRDFARPGWAKAALSLRVAPADGGSELVAETRVRCTDTRARLAFRPYWLAISGGGALVRYELLRAVARRAESAASA